MFNTDSVWDMSLTGALDEVAPATGLLGLIRTIRALNAVSPDLTRDRAATALNLLSNGSKTALVLQAGLNLISLSLGELSVSHRHFTWVGKGTEGTGESALVIS
nr:hypothetical protein [Halomonas utahensis]